jgi:tetratricopeptide (TPR) repeat protein
LLKAGDATSATAVVKEFRKLQPDHPDALAGEALIHLYTARESDALDLLPRILESDVSREIAHALADHYQCREQLAAKVGLGDPEALAAKSVIRSLFPKLEAIGGIRLSACLITKNEEAHLPRCLGSLAGLVDEIVVVDTGSTDGTREIAGEFGAVIGHYDWTDDFSAARNESLALATGDWAFWIDADEEVAASSMEAIHRAIVRPHFGGFAIEIVNFTDDYSESAQYRHKPVRLFQLRDDVRFTGRIHEQILPALTAADLPWANLDGALIRHYGYRPSEMVAKGKIERTITMLRREVEENPGNSFQWFNLANAYTASESFAEVVEAAKACAEHLTPTDPIGRLVYQLWTNALLKLGKASDALKVCDECDRRGFGGILNEFERANACLSLDLIPEGLEASARCLALEWPAGMTGDIGIAEYKRYICRGQLLSRSGDQETAIRMFEHALRAHPHYGPALYANAVAHELLGKHEAALELYLAGQADAKVGQLCLKGAGRCANRLGLVKAAVGYFREAWRINPNDRECWSGWVEAAESFGDADLMIEAYAAHAENYGPSVEICINWARALEQKGEFPAALERLEAAVGLDANNGNAWFNIGDLLYKCGNYEQAADAYQAGLRIQPENAAGWFVLGNAFAQLGILAGARISYEQALSLQPEYREAAHNLEIIQQAA